MSKHNGKFGSGTYESLSAFLDNEANAEDIERLLAADKNDLAYKLDHYHEIYQTVQPDSEHLIFDSSAFLAGIHDKLKKDIPDNNIVAFPVRNEAPQRNTLDISLPVVSESESKNTKGPIFGGLAVAASVALMVLLGGNLLLSTPDNGFSSVTATAARAPVIEQNVVPVQELRGEMALENNERLQSYLRQHAQQASMTVGQGMIPMARVVSYPQGERQ
ncbi:sigma-E factor negative regulatory protein [Rhodanobacter aciditrophus]|uniref:Sigma-E factor negative regulatory protein n=1 Tax=Rhodanobacter aciditrophus TaxID=1623218 RepID=A0ABW4AXB9_9GAMM